MMTLSRRDFSLLYLLQMLGHISVTMVFSLLPSVGRTAGIPDVLIVMTQSLSAIAWIVFGAFWARLATRRGRRHVILIGAVGLFFACLLTGGAIWIAVEHLVAPITGLIIMMVGRSLNGGVGLASNPASQAYIIERIPHARRTVMLSSLASAQAFGTVIGPALAPFLIHLPGVGLAGPMLIVAAIVLILYPFLFLLPNDGRAAATRPEPAAAAPVRAQSIYRMPAMRAFLLYSTIIATTVLGTVQSIGFLIIDVTRLSPDAAQPWIGRAIAGGAIATLLVQLVFIRLVKPTPRVMMIAGPLLAMAGLALLAAHPSYGMIALGIIIANAGFAIGRPGVAAAASFVVPMARQAEVAAALMSTASIATVFGPVLAVSLYTVWRPLPFLLMIAMLAVAFLIALIRRHDESTLPLADGLVADEAAPLG
ncbi:MFS transporter [Sphingobium nicotianae]|uniref:MFS transporter n=1 Tax=Sphingobium nicotianae TaxID=2782607 RepID=A0A9X1IQQ8_9SPHN|nr:MFS transporter [Sphingobium nicotianae]MBT2186809.1 MFS transporter [Sphingobium nicotianae]